MTQNVIEQEHASVAQKVLPQKQRGKDKGLWTE